MLKLAVVVLVVGLGAGALWGYTCEAPVYRASTLIYIAPPLHSPEFVGDGRGPQFAGFVAYQAELLRSRRATLMAMQTAVWKATGESHEARDDVRFQQRLRVRHERGTQHIQVLFDDPEPETALAGAQALLAAYTRLNAGLQDGAEKLEYARTQIEILQARQKSVTDQVLAFGAEYGGGEGLQIRHRATLKKVLEAEDQLVALERAIQAAEAKKQDTAELKARRDALWRWLEQIRTEQRKLGETRVQVDRLQAQKHDLERQLSDMRALYEQLKAENAGRGQIRIPDPGSLPSAPHRDPRPRRAALGAGLGVLPGVLLLLVALVRSRRRSTAQAPSAS